MKRKLTFLLAALLLSGLTWAQTTLNIADYATANNWENGVQYPTASVNDVTFNAIGGSNTGKYYSNDQSWRLYANESATLTISVPSGCSLVSVTPTFTLKDNGILLFGSNTISSGSSVNVSGEEVAFSVSQTSGNKGKVFLTEIEVSYTTGGIPNPSITASNVEIAYDATSGAIEYTINNGVTGGSLSATTASEWLTLGTVGTTVPFTCTANQTTAARTATVTLTYTYNNGQTVTKNISVTQAANPNAMNNISEITATGTYNVQGTIVAKSQRGFIVGDGTGYVYYYNQNYDQADYEIGDIVKLVGPVVVYGGVYEFNNTTTVTMATTSNYVAEDPTVLTGEQMDARVASTTPPQLSNYVQYEGTLSVNDTHYNITNIVGATTAIGSISFPIDTDEITTLDGKYVKVTGYYVGISTSTYYNTMLGSIEEIANDNPTLSAENVDLNYDATSGAIEYTINHPANDGVLTATTESDWLTLGTVGTTVPFTCTANSTTASRTATVTLTYTFNTDQTLTKNVTVTQAANPNMINNISEITAAGEYIVQGTIVAINNRGFILGDGTGYVYYYYGANGFEPGDYDIGDRVKLAGTVVVYGKVFEFNNSTEITYVDESNYVEEDPTMLSGADMDARVASSASAGLSSFIQYEGTLSISTDNNNTTHYNITAIDGAQTAIGSVSYPLNVEEIEALSDKFVRVTGYFVGVSSNTYYNTMLGSIEEVTVEEYTLTVSDLSHVNTYVFGDNENEMLFEGEGSAQVYNGTQVLISIDVEEGYVLQSLIVDGTDVTSQIDETSAYSFTMPTHDVIITATAVEFIPPVPGNWVLTSLADLTEDDVFVIVGTTQDGASYAMSNNNGTTKAPAAIEVLVAENTLSGEIADTLQWNLSITEDGYIFYPNDSTNIWLYCTNTNNGVRVGKGEAKHFTMDEELGYLTTTETTDQRYLGIFNAQDWRCYKLNSDGTLQTNIADQTFAFYKKVDEETPVTQPITLNEGSNYVSFYVDITIDNLKAAVEAAYVSGSVTIKTLVGGQTMYNGARWRGSLNVLDPTKMYMIVVENSPAIEIPVEGMPIDPAESPITIPAGTSWFGFPLTESMSVTDAFAGFALVNGDMVKTTTGQATYNNGRWRGALNTLEPGIGYIFKSAASVTEDRTLIFSPNK